MRYVARSGIICKIKKCEITYGGVLLLVKGESNKNKDFDICCIRAAITGVG